MDPAALVETHISVLTFIGDRAYKLKKPVRFPFADFTTRAAREQSCHREVELNRRLAPDVYLGVADVLDPDGQPCDHLVVMRRMPDDRRLAHLVAAADPDLPRLLDEIAGKLASFHADAERSPDIDRAGEPATIAGLWAENFDELDAFAGPVLDPHVLDAVRCLATDLLTGRDALFLGRIADGHVCDGHGDLQADDVFCLPDGPRILDCIEFSDALRHGDVAGDVAFLAMDLERLGRPDLAAGFLRAYEQAAGAVLPPALVHLSIAYRAQVRAKVACLRTAQHAPGSAAHRSDTAAARGLLDLCRRHLEAGRVRLVVVGGLPGTGKTTVARGVAERLGAAHLRSDVVRKELAGLDPDRPAPEPFGQGNYAPEVTARVYRELMHRAAAELALGRSVVLDASFGTDDERAAARRLAAEASAAPTELVCVLDPAVAAERIRRRLAEGHDASDADPAIAAAMSATFAPWPDAVAVPTDGPPEQAVARAVAATGTRPHPRLPRIQEPS